MTSDSSLIPSSSRDAIPSLYGMYSGAFNTIIIAPGFGYAFVAGPFSLTPIVLLGSGIQTQYYRIHDEDAGKNKTKSGLKLPVYANLKVAAGVNNNSIKCTTIHSI